MNISQTLKNYMACHISIETSQQVEIFQETPKESHIIVIKRILRYLKGIEEYGLWYPKGNNLIIQAFTDADWAGSIDDRKGTREAFEYLRQKLGILPSSH